MRIRNKISKRFVHVYEGMYLKLYDALPFYDKSVTGKHDQIVTERALQNEFYIIPTTSNPMTMFLALEFFNWYTQNSIQAKYTCPTAKLS